VAPPTTKTSHTLLAHAANRVAAFFSFWPHRQGPVVRPLWTPHLKAYDSFRDSSQLRCAMNSSFWKSGHTPTLFAAFLYFDLSFMVWYLLGPLAVQIATDLHLTTQQRGLMVATPILAGALLRFAMGLLADRLSPKTAGIIGQIIVISAL